jgi:hypothetical protein
VGRDTVVSVPGDPKTGSRIVATKKEWEQLHALLCPPGTRCGCGCGRRAESLHHLVGRGQGGDDVVDNLVALAGDGTRLCHGAITSSQRAYDMKLNEYCDPKQVLRGIRANLGRYKIEYVIRVKSYDWLDRRYPPA